MAYAFEENAANGVIDILGTIPGRWGRMPPLCRAVVVEAGRILRQHDLRGSSPYRVSQPPAAGLIGATRWGSHTTDLAFAASMKENAAFASPALFGYTLANIPLAEAANHYGLTGPVYALIDSDDPLGSAIAEARLLLQTQEGLEIMLACEFDAYYHGDDDLQLSVTFTIEKKR